MNADTRCRCGHVLGLHLRMKRFPCSQCDCPDFKEMNLVRLGDDQ